MFRVFFLIGWVLFSSNVFAKTYYIPLQLGKFSYQGSSVFCKDSSNLNKLLPLYSVSNFTKTSYSTLLKTMGYNIGLIGMSISEDFEIESALLFQLLHQVKQSKTFESTYDEEEINETPKREDPISSELTNNPWGKDESPSTQRKKSRRTKTVTTTKDVNTAARMRHLTVLGKTTLLHVTSRFKLYNACGFGYLQHFLEEDGMIHEANHYSTLILGAGFKYKMNTYMTADISYIGTVLKYNWSTHSCSYKDKDFYLKTGINFYFY